jgi:alkylation response protein AidB-like acyl-CoA dehydrogenase
MRFAFTEEQVELARVTRELLARECPPTAVRAAWDAPSSAPPVAWKALADAGIVGMTAPERFGGAGANELDLALVLEEAGRAALPAPLVDHVAVAIPLVVEIFDDGMIDRLLSGATTGASLLAVALGGAPLVEGAARARTILLEQDGGLAVIDPNHAGLIPHRSVDRSRRLSRVLGGGGDLPRDARIAAGLARAYDRGAFATAAILVGLGRRMIDMTVEYVSLRTQFGRPVGSFQAVKHMLAEAHVALELARPCVHRAAYALAHHEPDASRDVSLAKARASDAALQAGRAALQCHGAIGYSFEHDLHLWMKRAWALAATYGSAADHRARLASHLLDTPQGASHA